MLAVLKKELKSYYTSVFAYIFYAVFFLITGVLFVSNSLTTYSTQFGYDVLSKSFYVMVVAIPFCTMRLIASERKSKSDQLLFTAPISTFEVLLGKYLATVIFVLVPIVLSVLYPLYIAAHGTLSFRFLLGSYLGIFCVTMMLLSIGMFLSSLTANAVLAAVLTFAVYTVIILARILEGIFSSNEVVYTILHQFSPYVKLSDMVSGIVRSGDIVYMLSFVVCFFLLTWISLESRRESRGKTIAYGIGVVLVTCLVSGIAFANTRVYDFTAARILSLSDETKERVAAISNHTDIYYMGLKSRANATYQELLNAYGDLSDEIEIHYKDVANDSAFRQQYLYNVDTVKEGSILVVGEDGILYLDADDYVSTVSTSTYSVEQRLEIEEQLTRALVYVNTEEKDSLCVLSGHGEEGLNSGFSNLLKLTNYDFTEVNIASAVYSIRDAISEDTKATIINAPQTDYTEEELELLRDYIQNGGNLVVTLDPLNEELPNLYAFLEEYSFQIQSGVVVEQDETRVAYDTPYYLIGEITDTSYTKDALKNDLLVLPLTSKGILKKGSANGYEATDLLVTGKGSFAKVGDYDNITTKGDEDIAGPFSVASIATKDGAGSVFLITSNVFFNENADIESGGGNRRFFMEVLQEMTGTENNIWIEGKNIGNQTALFATATRGLVKMIAMVVIPICVLLLGVVVFLGHRKNIGLKCFNKRLEKRLNKQQSDKEMQLMEESGEDT